MPHSCPTLRPSVPPGRVEAGIVDRLGRIEAGNGPNGQRAVLALPTLVHTDASRNRGQLPASGAVSQRARLVDPCGGLTDIEILRQCGIDTPPQFGIAQGPPPTVQVRWRPSYPNRPAPAPTDRKTGGSEKEV